MRYIPVIIADGKEYVNTYYDNLEIAKRKLRWFIRVFKKYNDAKIENVFVREVK